jgi:hypothetical protein
VPRTVRSGAGMRHGDESVRAMRDERRLRRRRRRGPSRPLYGAAYVHPRVQRRRRLRTKPNAPPLQHGNEPLRAMCIERRLRAASSVLLHRHRDVRDLSYRRELRELRRSVQPAVPHLRLRPELGLPARAAVLWRALLLARGRDARPQSPAEAKTQAPAGICGRLFSGDDAARLAPLFRRRLRVGQGTLDP